MDKTKVTLFQEMQLFYVITCSEVHECNGFFFSLSSYLQNIPQLNELRFLFFMSPSSTVTEDATFSQNVNTWQMHLVNSMTLLFSNVTL